MAESSDIIISPLFDPIEASHMIGGSYLRYLKARYAPADENLQTELHDAFETRFQSVRGPFLQTSPAYQEGNSLRSLISEGIMHRRLQNLDPEALPPDRPLYQHQELALRKVIEGRNLIIATGTGSGKTECYLLPILNHLLNEAESGTLKRPGVRALLLYPMNALANDQMHRIRSLMRPFPEITYGRYTGATPESQKEGEQEYYTDLGKVPDPGELVSREQMRLTPPHLLLTNYAMLEYLLLRPKDSAFFDGPTGQYWRFIVLDELHTYSGSRGAEIAMLLRRMRDRVNRSERGKLKFIGTSATLGTGSDAPIRIAEFAEDLFGEQVEYHSHEEHRQDVIIPILEFQPVIAAQWKAREGAFFTFKDALISGKITEDVLALVGDKVLSQTINSTTDLLEVLKSEQHVLRANQILRTGPCDIFELADQIFTEPYHIDELAALLSVCTNAYGDNSPLISVRCHYMLRALEGAFLCMSSRHPITESRLHLERHRTCSACEDQGVQSQMFELGVCSRCAAGFLIGEDSGPDQDGCVAVRQASPHKRNLLYLLLPEPVAEDDEDEAAIVEDADIEADIDRRRLCTSCGCLSEAINDNCRCGATDALTVTFARPSKGQPLRHCPACSGRTNAEIVLRFFTGHDAPASVIATAIYQCLPPESPRVGRVQSIGEGRKLLTFSDSRQDAAFFAPYMERTYARAIQRRLIWSILDQRHEDVLRFEDLVPLIQRLAEDRLVIDPDDSISARQSRVRSWLMAEVLAVDRRQSLEGTGLAEITVDVPRAVTIPPALQRLGFTEQEIMDVVRVLLNSLRRQAAVHLPDGVDITDQIFAPRNIVTSVRAESPSGKVMAWMPARGRNIRLDYISKVFDRRGIQRNPEEVLNGIWRWLTDPNSGWNKVLCAENGRWGTVFRLDPKWITIIPVSETHPAYECSRCRQISWRCVSDVCPTWCCLGTLKLIDTEKRSGAEHYRHLYTMLEPSGMRVEEHTGQLETQRARKVQQDFLDYELNILSCTTTFELGVDLGDVKAILMRNVPPSPANYVQRAGRAGRRASTPALVVTFARRNSHDLYHFREPMGLIDGHVDVPILSLCNPLIVRRHIHAVAFAAYERHHVDLGGRPHNDIASFFVVSDDGVLAAVDDFLQWLHSHPSDLGESVARITPEEVAEELGVYNWQWVQDLTDDQGSIDREHCGWLARAIKEIHYELEQIDVEIEETMDRISELRRSNDNKKAENQARRQSALYKVKGTLESKRLIDYLATRVVLPKYGFPVDVVALDVWRDGDRRTSRVDLSRDLRMGITEYAPGSKVVADKTVWESIGLRILPGRALISYHYTHCNDCGAFRTLIDTSGSDEQLTDSCEVCSAATSAGKFIIPQFGFIGSASQDKPGESQPPKVGYSSFYFSDYDGEPPGIEEEIIVGNSMVQVQFSRQGRITVINTGNANRGFRVCLSCGYTESTITRSDSRARSHNRPGTRRECYGRLSLRHLGHHYLTDVVQLDLMQSLSIVQARSILYALLAATPALGIPTDEVNGVLVRTRLNNRESLVVFDTVPGGAGHVRRLRENLQKLLETAFKIVNRCRCATNTSCYGCIRTYRNQEFHGQLIRGEAERVLGDLLNMQV